MESGKHTNKIGNPTTKTSKPFVPKLVLVCAIISLTLVSAVGFVSFNERAKMKKAVDTTTIYNNIFINDVDVSGLSKVDAIKKLNESTGGKRLDSEVIVKHQDKSMNILIKAGDVDYSAAVEEAFSYARSGSIKERFALVEALKASPQKLTYEPKLSLQSGEVKAKLLEFAKSVDTAPQDAKISRANGAFLTTPEKDGVKLNVDQTLALIEKLVKDNKGGEVFAVVSSEKPKITVTDLEKSTTLLGTFETNYSGDLKLPRNTNIVTAASKLNNIVVAPNEIVSINKIFGAMTFENGYRLAPVIEQGKLVQGMGGGVCQVSSTLYNALLFAELDIVERQNHSKKVGYVDYGFDATLAGDYIDLKFKNNSGFPIFIESILNDGKMKVSIFGYETHDPSRKIVFSNALVSTLQPGAEEIVEDPELPKDKRVEIDKAKTGYKYRVYKTVYENGKELEKTVVNESTYRPTRSLVKVGTKELEAKASEPTPSPEESLPPDFSTVPDARGASNDQLGITPEEEASGGAVPLNESQAHDANSEPVMP